MGEGRKGTLELDLLHVEGQLILFYFIFPPFLIRPFSSDGSGWTNVGTVGGETNSVVYYRFVSYLITANLFSNSLAQRKKFSAKILRGLAWLASAFSGWICRAMPTKGLDWASFFLCFLLF